ncbi:hypothetical protein AB1285_25450, partial [Microbacterium sp. NRRL B-14842]|uniref:hypothetical protein n=1 Tax=Microbacterium sp. NRRL B-14842 TaxID=3162881 RepID=UPI003D279071
IALELGNQVASFGVKSAYGEPQEIDGSPSLRWRSPTRASAAPAATEEKAAGGGVVSVPVGVYVRREEGLRFEPNIVTPPGRGRALRSGSQVGHSTRIIRALKK